MRKSQPSKTLHDLLASGGARPSVLVAVLAVLPAFACRDATVTDPESSLVPVTRVTYKLLASAVGSSCPNVPSCALQVEQTTGDEVCVCTIEGIGVTVGGNPPPPPPPPPPDSFPPPPGFPAPTGGAGGGTAGAGGVGSEGCDICIDCPPECFSEPWTASIACTAGPITRGNTISCSLKVTPASSLDFVNWWGFQGDNIVVTQPTTALQWGGPLVESGRITVDFKVAGTHAKSSMDVVVSPRTGGIWTQAQWASQIVLHEDEPATALCGFVEDGHGVGHSWLKGHHGSGCNAAFLTDSLFSKPPVPTGPNKGAIWTDRVVADYTGSSHVHPEARPGAVTRPLPDPDQAEECRQALNLPTGSAVAINLWNFNASCKGIANMASFVPASLAHERQHFDRRRAFLLGDPANNVYLELEKLVASTVERRNERNDTILQMIADGARTADKTQPEPTGNFPGGYWKWALGFTGFIQNLSGF